MQSAAAAHEGAMPERREARSRGAVRAFAILVVGAALGACGGHDPCDGLPCGATCCLEYPLPSPHYYYPACSKEGKCDNRSRCVEVTPTQGPVCNVTSKTSPLLPVREQHRSTLWTASPLLRPVPPSSTVPSVPHRE